MIKMLEDDMKLFVDDEEVSVKRDVKIVVSVSEDEILTLSFSEDRFSLEFPGEISCGDYLDLSSAVYTHFKTK